METVYYTISSFIDAVLANHSDNEYTLDSKNDELVFCITSYGDSIDCWSPEDDEDPYRAGEWVEDAMIYQENYPLEDDEDIDDVVRECYSDPNYPTPVRSHSYGSCYREFYLMLPPNRKRGDRYTLEQMREMIKDVQNHEDHPGMGFSYHNMPACEYCSERLERA